MDNMKNGNEISPQNGARSERIQWIDYLKGFAILGVIFVHTRGHFDWWTDWHVNTIFFFLAGMFFKPRPFLEFVKRHFWGLIVPFLIFFLCAYVLKVALYIVENHSFSAEWKNILDLFKIDSGHLYLDVYMPLWFILTLFWIQLIYFALSKTPKWVNIVVLFLIYICWDIISNIPTPFMINTAVCYTLYFGLGNLLGRMIVNLVDDWHNSVYILVAGVVVMILIDQLVGLTSYSHARNLFFISWCIVLLAAFSLFKNVRFMKWLGFFGTNTLVILGCHGWFLLPLWKIQSKLIPYQNGITALLIALVCTLIMIPMSKLISKYIPAATGKRRGKKIVDNKKIVKKDSSHS